MHLRVQLDLVDIRIAPHSYSFFLLGKVSAVYILRGGHFVVLGGFGVRRAGLETAS